MKTLNQFLLAKFDTIKASNPRFSLRALAQKADISPGHLSEILTGKRGVTGKNLEKLSAALRLTPDDVATAQRFLDSEKDRKKATQSIEKVLTQQEFAEISGIEYFLVLAAMDLSIDNLDVSAIARKTGLSEEQAEAVINKFLKLGILENRDNGSFNKSLRSLCTESDIPNFDVQRFHKDTLDKTKEIFPEVPTAKREMVYMTMAINPKNIPAAKKEIEKCWKKVYTKLSQGPRTEIYTLGIQLVPAATGKEN